MCIIIFAKILTKTIKVCNSKKVVQKAGKKYGDSYRIIVKNLV